uniref:Uncharacterized protein n=1 Tax=Panagrolaimus sp. PS1159 TaxID=55785 RepID=A0AC35EQS6_9BILA
MSVKEYNPAVYNLLGDLKVTSEAVTIQDIFLLGKIIQKHNYSDKVCVVIAHRHHDLNDNEVMYEVIDSERRISEPRLLSNVAGKAQPNLLSCGPDGAWYPVGYEADETLTAWNDTKFMAEVAKYLIDNNFTDKLALGSRHSVEKKYNGAVYIEENRRETRQSITRLSSNEELIALKAIPTTYSFNKDTAEPQVDFFCGICW